MTVQETNLKGCFIIQPTVFEDKRGYFLESFNREKFNTAIGEDITFVQDNESFSTKGVLRGLHYQIGEHAQAKLVRVIKGRVLDIAVDIRPDSPTYGQHVAVELSEENKTQFFVPRGFAHGFVVLSDTAIFSYKCDNFYNKASEGGIIYNDPSLNINWQLPEEQLIISEKDAILPILENALI
ncbi:dTDP-4-dehydrorhamnose 3,5-epimerase [Mangrovimonas sp. TPBH4]|uniref:dTDP-4-dehydrorhamnose 3,5-epimerase n=1 Tax=Mangrovimonas sp. TPBH4 TaxID=1645914 RepID=UPI0006B5A929|nr:dTDP-4-dehydrorhamnose 3,5-epimerase [Mangrovimonas sp. TPBH4]